MCSCRGPSACKQGRRIYNTLLLQAMALYIHGPLRCKNLLGRIPNPHSCHVLAAPQHRQENAQHYPHAHDQTARRASRTHAAHTHTAQIRHPAAHAGSCATPAVPHDQPPDSTKARPATHRTGFFFCMMEPETARRQRSGKMQLLFQSLLQHPGEVDPLRHCGIIQPRRNRKGFLDRLFKMLFGILCHIH